MTLAGRIADARRALTAAGIAPRDAALDADVLACRALDCDRAQLAARLRDEEPAAFGARFDALVARRSKREPLAYVLGEREFWGLPFEVNGDVLVPRPESELIVEESLQWFAGSHPAVVLDVCTGSGCLAVALAHEFPAAAVVATDISAAALAVARRNAARNGVGDRVTFRQADLLDRVETVAALMVCNPPYVNAGDQPGLMPEVRDYEPHVALFGGADGLAFHRRLLASAGPRLAPGGKLVVEVGYDQDGRVADLAAGIGWRLAGTRQDLQGITRTLVFERT